jgi:phosphate transport system permease protein
LLKIALLDISFTLLSSLIATAVAVPLGLGAAIFLSEYASLRARSILKPILEVLAGIPTVVYGFFALTFMTPLLRAIFGQDTVEIYNLASAGLVMGIMILPLISSLSQDALSAVPRALREGAFGLGATRWETATKVVLPAALSGIFAALIIAVSRALGETMIVALAAGAGPNFTLNPFRAAETITRSEECSSYCGMRMQCCRQDFSHHASVRNAKCKRKNAKKCDQFFISHFAFHILHSSRMI